MVCPECGEILSFSAGTPAQGAESIRQGKRARQAIRTAAERQDREEKRRRRSGASHATVEMPALQDGIQEGEPVLYTVSASRTDSRTTESLRRMTEEW